MRGVTLEAKCRGVERATGATITLVREGERPIRVTAYDPELDYSATVQIPNPSSAERCIMDIHALIYRKRSMKVMENQNHKCIACDERHPLEIDHKDSRGAHGRNDRMSNLQAVCSYPYGCNFHRKKHGG